jgi:hypothetical protein
MKVKQNFEIIYRFQNQRRNQHEAGRKLNLKMEAVYPSENSFEFHHTTQ